MRSEEEWDIVKRGQKLVQNQWTFAKPGAVRSQFLALP